MASVSCGRQSANWAAVTLTSVYSGGSSALLRPARRSASHALMPSAYACAVAASVGSSRCRRCHSSSSSRPASRVVNTVRISTSMASVTLPKISLSRPSAARRKASICQKRAFAVS